MRTSGLDPLLAATERISRSVQTTIGWIFWDPGAIERYARLGLPTDLAGPLGYIAARCAPLAPAGPDAVIAAFGSISPFAIRGLFALLESPTRFDEFWHARDDAVLDGLVAHAPDIIEPLVTAGPELWSLVDRLPLTGRVMFASLARMPRPTDPLLSAWHAVNAIREWRGDTHWAIVAAAGLDHAEASILHNEWLGYETDWIATSRGTDPHDLDAGWASLQRRGLADGRRATRAGLDLRARIERDTDAVGSLPWAMLGVERTNALASRLEPPCELLLARVDLTAGPNYQPASRIHDHP